MAEEQSRDDERREAREAAALASHVIEGLMVESAAAAQAAKEAAGIAADEIGQLRVALATRLVIGQAQGILMARLDIDSEQAFAFLVRVSSTRNVKLREIAAEIVQSRRIPNDR